MPVVLSALKEDRQRIAQWLHDGPCQTLAAAQILAQLLVRETEKQGPPVITGRERELAAAVSKAMEEIHYLLCELRASGNRVGTDRSGKA